MRFPTFRQTLVTLVAMTAGASTHSVAAQSAAADRGALVARIDSLIREHLTNGPASSAAVAVVRGADTIVMRGYGLADRTTNRAAGPTTVYEIGSITKQFTSSAIMRLVEQGKIRLDDDLSKYVPTFPLQGKHVTIRQLLNHTSGIHSYTSNKAWATTWSQDLTPDSIVGFVARDTFDFAPGSRWLYNNTGYVLLGMVIEKVTGKPYAAYLDEQFFKPLGLKQTRYCPAHPTDTTYALGYSARNKELVPSTYLSLTHPFSAGALCSTARDYLVWQRALHGGRVVSAASYTQMTTPDTLNNGSRLNYGFGLTMGQIGTHRMITHGGGINGFTTAQLYFPADTLSVIVFTNTDAAGPDGPAMNIARAVFGMPIVGPAKVPPVVALDPAERDKVLGTYDLLLPNGGKLPMRVFVEGQALMSQAEGQGAIALLHYGNGVFGASFDPSVRISFVAENGVITKMRLLQGGGTIEGARRP
ncbi:MAG: serine hydrolase domain-containing protein [bacterium]